MLIGLNGWVPAMSRFTRTAPDYDAPGAPDPTPTQRLFAAFLLTCWPEEAFDDWRTDRVNLQNKTGIPWPKLNTSPPVPDDLNPDEIDKLYPETIKQAPMIRVLQSNMAKEARPFVYIDSARLFWKYSRPVHEIALSSAGDFLYSGERHPGCLFLRLDGSPPDKVLSGVHSLFFRYQMEGRRIVIIPEIQLFKDPLKLVQYDGVCYL